MSEFAALRASEADLCQKLLASETRAKALESDLAAVKAERDGLRQRWGQLVRAATGFGGPRPATPRAPACHAAGEDGAVSIQLCGNVDACKVIEGMLRGKESTYMGDHVRADVQAVERR